MARGHMNCTNTPNAWLRRPATQRNDFPLPAPDHTQMTLSCRSVSEADSLERRIGGQETPLAVILFVVAALVFEVGGAWTISRILLRYATRLGYLAIVALGGVSRGA